MTFRMRRRRVVSYRSVIGFHPFRFECCLGKAITSLRALVERQSGNSAIWINGM